MEPVALCTREITRSAIFRRDFARVWWHVTLVWSLQWLATKNCKTEKKSREWATKMYISLIVLIFQSFLLDYKKWENSSRPFLLNSTIKTCQQNIEVCEVFIRASRNINYWMKRLRKIDHDSKNYDGWGLFYQQKPNTEALTQTKTLIFLAIVFIPPIWISSISNPFL